MFVDKTARGRFMLETELIISRRKTGGRNAETKRRR